MESEEIKKNHEICLELLDKFLEICEKYKIDYTLSSGSVLGAVRHKGFIPWDINIDILLSVKEYYRLDAIMKAEDLGNMAWVCPKQNGRMHSLLVRYDSKKYKSYPNVDVEVYANVSDNRLIRAIQFKIAYLNVKMFKIKNTKVKRMFPFNILKGIASIFPNALYYVVMRKLENYKKNTLTTYQIDVTPAYFQERQVMKSNWIWGDTFMYGEFEGRTVKLPIDYNSFLIKAYGSNYMTPIVWESKGEYFHVKKDD